MSTTFSPAIWKRKDVTYSKSVIQTGESQVAEVIVDGIQFRSFLPNSAEERDAINAAARKIANRPPQIVLE